MSLLEFSGADRYCLCKLSVTVPWRTAVWCIFAVCYLAVVCLCTSIPLGHSTVDTPGVWEVWWRFSNGGMRYALRHGSVYFLCKTKMVDGHFVDFRRMLLNCSYFVHINPDLACVFFQIISITSHSLQTHIYWSLIPPSHWFIGIVLHGTVS